MKIVIAGVAGIFVALAFVGYGLTVAGHWTSDAGASLNLPSLVSSGDSMVGWGTGIIVLLIALAVFALVVLLRR